MSKPAPTPDPEKLARERAKLRRTILILAPILIIGGALILAFLTKMPLPLRIIVGLGDIVAGLVLLILLKQKFFDK
ncbi:MAG: hypothetical protein V4773_12840 [Verrucomicrobiota bacterium]